MARLSFLLAILLVAVGCSEPPPASLTQQGLKEVRSGQYDAAIRTCSQAIAENPQNAEAYLYRGRAYQFRNAMGDPHRAIADFTEAIRLAPDSPDAYYSRAIAYRDLGETELAAEDDKQARAADSTLQDLYRRLPETVPPPKVAGAPPQPAADDAAKPASGGGALMPESAFDQRSLYEELKERFDPEAVEANESPIARYNRLSRQPIEEDERPPESAPLPKLLPRNALGLPASPAATPTIPGLSGDPTTLGPRTTRPAPSSPFAPRLPDDFGSAALPPGMQQNYRPVQSPFGARAPAPTGRVEPTNPFGQQAPRTVAPQSRPRVDPQFSNPAVRPDNPRDFLP